MNKPVIRCAIYTRKSSEEGLDQDFNSLDAQAEACAAYIASQRHEGWKAIPARYDDGGISGGTLERPALQRLLADIDAGRVDMIVVYKIDRLTRSLADFAKLVERLEAAGASFVSVTQAFNTSTSMGRLTLNVLLSFAQFEREVTAERIRDKIAASKKKGLWMGGIPPLGYDPHPDPHERQLVVNQDEAQTVAAIFGLYGAQGCLRLVEAEARRQGLRSKHHHFSTGRIQGGTPFSRGQIHHLLTNPVYRGQIRHKDKVWPGQHPAIIEDALWSEVQAKLQAARARPRRGRGNALPTGRALLAGKLRDETGDRLTPTHTSKGRTRIGYYVSNRLIRGGPDPSAWRLPARELEAFLAATLAHHLVRAASTHALIAVAEARSSAATAARAQDLAATIRKYPEQHLRDLIHEGRLSAGTITIVLNGPALATRLDIAASDLAPETLTIAAPFEQRRRGVETRLVAGDRIPAPDRVLIQALARSHRWAAALRDGESLASIAAREGVTDAFITARLQLAFLAPKIQAAILEGRLPPDLTLERIRKIGIALDWAAQPRDLGLSV